MLGITFTLGIMTQRKLLQESGTLAAGSKAGTYRVCLITEGVGSSGVYPREMFTQENADALGGSLSFMNHPENPWRPERRPAEDIVGLVGDSVSVEEHDGLQGFWADYTPRKSKPGVAEFIEEYKDKLGLSVFIAADGYIDEVTERFVVESFDGSDPYKSVDIVVAAGRGGKFDRALEAFKALEPTEPPVTSAVESQQEEGRMDKEIEGRFNALESKFDALITAQEAALAASAQAEATAKASDERVTEASTSAVKSFSEKIAAIEAAEDLSPKQIATLRARAEEGHDITADLASAVEIAAEFKARENEDTFVGGRILGEAAVVDGPEFAGRVFS